MRRSLIWELFGDAISSRHKETLCAYLGDCDAQHALENESILAPTIDDFRGDPVFDPNPHGLDLPKGCLDLSLFVHSLAVWGPDALIRSALACATLQVENQIACPSHLVPARDGAFRAVKASVETPTDVNRSEVIRACAACQNLYAPYDNDPDSADAQTAWSHLGASWFAAETAAQDYRLEDLEIEGVSLSPAPPLVLNLSASVRRRIYSLLATSELNPGHRYPFRFRPEVFRATLAQADLPRAKATVVRQLAYKDEGTVCLADVSALSSALTTNEFSRLLKSLHQTPTLVLRVRVPALDDVDGLVRYWGSGSREDVIKPFLEGLAKVPGPKSVSISFFLPAFARTRLYTFPDPDTAPAEPRQDCLWTALNFFNDQPDNRLLENDYAERALRTGFERKPGRPSYGDLVLLSNPTGDWVHMGVYIADEVMFTKSGAGSMQPWVLMKIPDAMIQFQSLGAVQPVFYARKPA